MKKFVNFRFVVTLVLAVFANVVTYAQDNVVDEVVWVVGDEAILKSDVEEARMDALYNGRRFDGDPYCVIPEEIAVQKLFLHQAKLDSIEVSEAEIIQRVDMLTNMYIQQIGSREKMEEYFNKTSAQIRETLRDNARDGLTVQKMQQKLEEYKPGGVIFFSYNLKDREQVKSMIADIQKSNDIPLFISVDVWSGYINITIRLYILVPDW